MSLGMPVPYDKLNSRAVDLEGDALKASVLAELSRASRELHCTPAAHVNHPVSAGRILRAIGGLVLPTEDPYANQTTRKI